jgi:hypothetical protein
MFVSGFSTHIISGDTISQICPKCGAKNLRIYGLKKVFDLFRLFFFPVKTDYEIKCDHCESTYNLDRFGLSPKKIKIKYPVSLLIKVFSFPLILIFVLGCVIWVKIAEANYIKWKIGTYLTDLRVGDHIVIKQKDGTVPYTILKVIHVDQDTMTYVMSQFNFSNLEGVKDQILNPQIDMGREQNTISKDKVQNFEILEIYGPLRYGKKEK